MELLRTFGRALRAASIAVATFIIAGYLLLCGLVVYSGGVFVASGGGPVTPAQAGLDGFAAVRVPTEDGERLSGWWKSPPDGRGAVLVLIGNAGVQLSDYREALNDLAQNGLGVLGIEYRGNKGSTGRQNEAGIDADARAGFDFIRATEPHARIAVYGQSFGTGVAVQLARERPVAGLVLDAAYASIRRQLKLGGGIPLPYGLLIGDPLDSEAAIGQIHVPVMIMNGTADERIPIGEARRLFAAANEPKTMIEVAGGGHGSGWSGGRERALKALAEWTAGDLPAPVSR
jgi:hypothetical protein